MARRNRIGRGRGPGQRPHHGSRTLGEDESNRHGGAGCLLPLLGLLLLAAVVVVLVLVLGGDDEGDTSSTTPATGSVTTTSSQEPTPDGAAADATTQAGGASASAVSGSVVAGDAILLPLPGGGLSTYDGQDVTGTSVPVESVVSDEGFWVGESQEERLFVQLNVSGESPFKVTKGQTVTLHGKLTPLQGDPMSVGVTDAEGASQLRSEGSYILAGSLQQG